MQSLAATWVDTGKVEVLTVFWIHDICVDPDPEPRIHASDSWIRIILFSSLTFWMPTKNKFFKQFFCLLLLKEHLHRFYNKKVQKKSKHCRNQCCGSGSESGCTGSTSFWASRIRILLSLSKNRKKSLDFYCLATSF
jgi:hypothetical protein